MAIPPGGFLVTIPNNLRPIPAVDGTPKSLDNTATIDSGPIAGEVFDGRGNSFLDPNDILASINQVGRSIGGKRNGLLAGNLNSIDIMRQTEKATNDIFSRNFIPPTIQVPIMNLPLALPLPAIGATTSANQFNLASLFMTNLIMSLGNMGPPVIIGTQQPANGQTPAVLNGRSTPPQVPLTSTGNFQQQLLNLTNSINQIVPRR